MLVVPQHTALALANSLASLDALSGGRLTVGAGVGWSEAEFAALGQSFTDRGKRFDEMIDVLRACWGTDPVDFDGEYVQLDAMKVQPKPAHAIPIWIGGSSEPAYVRAVTRGDGFHAIGLDPAGATTVVARLRRERPDPAFTISLRTGWDPQGMEPDVIRRERDEFETAGIQHVVERAVAERSRQLAAFDGAARRPRARPMIVESADRHRGQAGVALVERLDVGGRLRAGGRAVDRRRPRRVACDTAVATFSTPRDLPEGQFGTL